MQARFVKMQGAGNRILIVDQRREDRPPPSPARLRELADPGCGPGFDQLMWLSPAANAAFAASYRVFNADGSEVEQCGNGVRCVARMLSREQGGLETISLDSPAGPVEARILDDGRVAVCMGAPVFDPARIPFVADEARAAYALEVDDLRLDVAVVSLGNPHCVIDVADVATADVGGLGPLIEHHPRFPEKTNVGFMHVVDRRNIELRVHERGVGETMACGTGACAAFVVARCRGLVDDEAVLHLPGGQLMVSWRGDAEPLWLTGPAEFMSEGAIEL